MATKVCAINIMWHKMLHQHAHSLMGTILSLTLFSNADFQLLMTELDSTDQLVIENQLDMCPGFLLTSYFY